MKRTICLLLCALCALMPVGCGKDATASASAASGVSSAANLPKDSSGRDITDELEDLGLLADVLWGSKTAGQVLSHTPHDMRAFNGKVYITCGSFQDNTGPVSVCAYRNDSTDYELTGMLSTEQNDELFVFDGRLYTLSTDQKEWGVSDVYYLGKGDLFHTADYLLKECYHCFDMEQYHGSLFFSGASVYGGRYKGGAYRLDCDIVDAFADDVTDLKIVDRHGTVLDYTDAATAESAPRLYELFVFRDVLYGVYFSGVGDPDRSGLYRYDEAAESFVQETERNAQPMLDRIFAVSKDSSHISQCFTYRDRQYFLTDTEEPNFFATDDLIRYDRITVNDDSVNDVIFCGDTPYILASHQDGDAWQNTVYRTDDFATFTPVVTFRTTLVARRMEYLDGAFYFGLGIRWFFDPRGPLPAHADDCGRILRWFE